MRTRARAALRGAAAHASTARNAFGYNRDAMSLSPPLTPEREAIASALSQVQRRLQLNRALIDAALIAGLLLLALLTWRALRWLGDAAPASAALVILLAIIAAVLLIGLLARTLFAQAIERRHAAVLADRRTNLDDELTTASYFLDRSERSDWVEAQLARARTTAQALRAQRVVPLRMPPLGAFALAFGLIALIVLWIAPPLHMPPALAPSAAMPTPHTAEGMAKLREIVAAMPESAAAKKLQAALQTMERPDATPEQRRQAAAQAQEAIEQMKIEAAAKREDLQQLSDVLRGQPGMEKVAGALAAGDAKRAADMLAQIEQQQAKSSAANAPEPADAKAGEKTLAETLQQATESSGGAESQAPSQQAMKDAIDRLNEIARQLQQANYVNEAWKQVKGAQIAAPQASGVTSGRFAEQTQANSTPSPGSGETPMGGGSLVHAPEVGDGKAKTQQEGGTRAGEARGDAPPDPLLGSHPERLEAQLQRAGISGEEQDGKPQDQPWFFSETKEQKSVVDARAVQASAQFANAEAGNNKGISIEHRQLVKDYFMKMREGAR